MPRGGRSVLRHSQLLKLPANLLAVLILECVCSASAAPLCLLADETRRALELQKRQNKPGGRSKPIKAKTARVSPSGHSCLLRRQFLLQSLHRAVAQPDELGGTVDAHALGQCPLRFSNRVRIIKWPAERFAFRHSPL